MQFTKQVFFSMLLGVVVGIVLNLFFLPNELIETVLINNIFTALSTIFITLLKMVVLPLIFVSLISGIVSINDASTLGRIGLKTISLYIFTTVIAITLALIASTLVGYDQQNLNLQEVPILNSALPESKSYILTFLPENFFASLADGNVIHVLVFAIFIGVAASLIKDEIKVYINLPKII